jgi:hypothetical protein
MAGCSRCVASPNVGDDLWPARPGLEVSDGVVLRPPAGRAQRRRPGMSCARDVAASARRHQVLRSVVVTKPVEVVDHQAVAVSAGRLPAECGAAPMAALRTWADGVVQDDAMLVGASVLVGERMSRRANSAVPATMADRDATPRRSDVHVSVAVPTVVVHLAPVRPARAWRLLASRHSARRVVHVVPLTQEWPSPGPVGAGAGVLRDAGQRALNPPGWWMAVSREWQKGHRPRPRSGSFGSRSASIRSRRLIG